MQNLRDPSPSFHDNPAADLDSEADAGPPRRAPRGLSRAAWRDFHTAPARRCDLSVDDVAAHWLARQEADGRRSMRDAQSALRRHVVGQFEGMTCRDLGTDHVEAWLRALQADGYAPATMVRLRSYLSCILQHAVSLGAADANVVRELPRGALPTRRARDPGRGAAEVLSLEEIAAVVHCLEVPVSRRLLWGVALLGGLRFGELAALRWGDLKRREPLDELRVGRSWDCRAHVERTPKNGLVRRVPVHPVVVSLIAQVREVRKRQGRAPRPGDLLCPSSTSRNAGRWHDTSAIKFWRQDLRTAGISDPASGPRRLHSTRHTFVTQLIEADVSDRVWQTLTHVPPDIGGRDAADTYAHPSWQTLCRAVLRIELPGERRV